MAQNPFKNLDEIMDIHDSSVKTFSNEVDGDIVIADSYRKKTSSLWKGTAGMKILVSAVAMVFAFMLGKLYYLQIVRGAEYYGAAEGNRIQTISITPPRGVIFDSNQKRVAYNVPVFALYVTPSKLPKTQKEEDRIFKTIARILEKDHFDLVEEFARVPRSSRSKVELARGINQTQAVSLSRYVDSWNCVSLEHVQQRTYSVTEPLSHVLGYTGKISENDYDYFTQAGYRLVEHVGKSGVEKTYQDYLHGTSGSKLVEVNSSNVPTRELGKKEPIAGKNIYLSINERLQEFIWEQIIELEKEYEIPGVSVIVMNPNNGLVKSLVSYPGFNNNLFARGISSKKYQSLLNDKRMPLFNRSISGEYPSGSTIKLIVGAAGLQEGIVNRYTTILSTGGIEINDYKYPDWKPGGHGKTNIIHALAKSVNTYFYAIGGGYKDIDGLGIKKIVEYGKKFGLASKTKIDLPSEADGFLPSKKWKKEEKGENWYLGDTYHVAIGQGYILVTPIQVANFTSVIANGGTLYAPRVVERIGREYENALKTQKIVLNSDFIEKENINIIQQGLKAAVVRGTVRSLSNLSVEAAGKTGTAQFSRDKEPHAWFTGYAPYKNPEIVVTVLVEQGKGGDITATPLAKKIFEWYFDKKQNKTNTN